MQTAKQMFQINPDGTKRAGIFITPDDFLTNPDKCPMVVFSHGVGEAGDGTLGPVNNILANGCPLQVASDGKLTAVICPVTGKAYRFAAFGLQGTGGWCVPAVGQAVAIKQLLKDNPQLDATAVFKTGLSAGGELTWEAIEGPDAALYCAAVPMSTPGPNTFIMNVNNIRAKVWAFHGNQDGTCDHKNSVVSVDAVNAVKKGYAYLTTYPGDHGSWGTYFNPSYRETFGGKSMSIYEWFLACKNSNILFTASGTENSGGGTIVNTMGATKAVLAVTVANNIATLDITGSVFDDKPNIPGTFYFTVLPSNGGTTAQILPDNNGVKGDGKIRTFKAGQGSYKVFLNIQSSYGAKDITAVDIDVPATGTVPPVIPPVVVPPVIIPPAAKQIRNITMTIYYTDGTSEIISK